MGTLFNEQAAQACPENRLVLIDDYLSGKLDEATMKAFETHFFQCDDCLQSLQYQSELKNLLKDETPALFPNYQPRGKNPTAEVLPLVPSLPLRNFANWAYLSAAAVLLSLVLFNLSSFFGKHKGIDLPLPENISAEQVAARYGENFISLPSMEEEVTTRTTKTIVEVFPPNESVVTFPLRFRWQLSATAVEEFQPYQFSLMDNRRKVLDQQIINEREYFLKSRLIPGLYYWTLSSDSHIFHTGKFWVLPQ